MHILQRMKVFLTALGLLTLTSLQAQTTVRKFTDSLGRKQVKSYFLYQSTLRALNVKKSDDLNMFMKDIKKISIYLMLDGVDSMKVDNLIKRVKNEGYGPMRELQEFEGQAVVLVKGRDTDDPHYLAIGSGMGRTVMVELDGQPNMEYADALKEIDLPMLRGFFEKKLTEDEKEEFRREQRRHRRRHGNEDDDDQQEEKGNNE